MPYIQIKTSDSVSKIKIAVDKEQRAKRGYVIIFFDIT